MILHSCRPTSDQLPPGFGDSGVPRSPGVHVSTIVYYLYRTVFKPAPEDAPETEAELLAKLCQFEKGFTWERALELAFRDRMAIRVDEIERDGIIGSPDGLKHGLAEVEPFIVDEPVLWLEEYKCTTKSAGRELSEEKDWLWITATKAYCKLAGTRYCRFKIMHLCGDYKGARGPVFKVTEIEYTQEEIDSNWNMLVNHKHKVAGDAV